MHRSKFRKTATTALALSILLALQGLLLADTIHFYDGRKLEGKILSEDYDKLVIKTKYGTQTIDMSDIEKIEKTKSERELYEEKRAKLGGADAEGRYQLGLWCKENGLPDKAETEFEKAIEIDPKHEGARKELGYEKHEGEWLTRDEIMDKKGFKKWRGEWISSEDYDKKMKEKIQKEKDREQKEATKLAEEVKKATEAAMKEYEGVPWEKRYQITTKHFVIECNSIRKIADKYAWLMDRLYDKYSKVFAAFKPQNRKCNIYIHRSHQEFMRLRRRPAGVGGYYIPGQYKLYGFHGSFGATSNTCTVLAHEGTHLFQDLIGMFGRPVRSPIWLVEGLAVLMEAADVNWRSGKIKIKGVSRDRLGMLQAELSGKRGKAMTLQTVLNTPQRGFSGRHYAYAGMLSYWLLQGAGKKHAQVYNDYVKIATGWERTQPRQIKQGDFEGLLDKYLKCTLSDIEDKWKKWVLKQKLEKLVTRRGRKYACKKLGFSVEGPSSNWKGDTEDVQPGEMIVFSNKKLDGRITVTAGGNFMNYTLETLVDAIKKSYSQSVSKGDLTDYKLVSEKFDMVKGHRVYDFTNLAKSPKSTITKELMKRRYIYFVTPDNIYSVRLMAPPDKYDQCLVDFLATLESFEIDL